MRILVGATAITLMTTALITTALMITALMTVSAHAQGMGGGGKRHQQSSQSTDDKTTVKADDKAYRDALKRIPVPTEKPDPWKMVR